MMDWRHISEQISEPSKRARSLEKKRPISYEKSPTVKCDLQNDGLHVKQQGEFLSRQKEPCLIQKEPYILWKEPHLYKKKPYNL